jgi:hypothetical protein
MDVDQEAKNALHDPVSNCSIPYTDFKLLLGNIFQNAGKTTGTSKFVINYTKYIP